jgi:hypothetical protein
MFADLLDVFLYREKYCRLYSVYIVNKNQNLL